MKSSHRISILTLSALSASLALVACGGAEVEPTAAEQASVTAPVAPPSGAPAPGAPGHERRAGGPRHHGPPSPEKMIERFDANKNGTLEASELPEKFGDKLASVDANKDNVVSKEELAAHFQAKGAEHAKQRFARKDKNGDGVLDQTEVGSERWAKLSVADANGDQKLSAEELRVAFESGKIVRPEHRHGDRRPE